MSGEIGFIGLGIMGLGMAKNLVKAGRSLVVWNRDVSKSEAFVLEFGGQIAGSAKEVIERCEITYSMLSTLEASDAVFLGEGGALSGISAGKCLIDCATLTPEKMMETGSAVAAAGGTFLEAPVSGSKGPAEQGTLIFLCGGSRELYDRVKADLEAMGKADYFLGAVGAGSRMKLVVNMVMGGMMNCLAEGLALADAADLPLGDLVQILDQGAMSNPMFRMKGPKMAAGDHAPNFPLKHQQKDMRFAVELGDRLGVALPVAAAANEAFKRARPAHGDLDFSAVYETTKKQK
uniref:6-phosphogluconate dehydrogenase NADP-binding domain-containing protein n=1 Tax=Heterosigma akashiwo TaxID=2829 RepID=A0A6V1X3J8_HETAK|mmetsp:Transcript_15189/g.28458  ORF Transcript_15189/g.28458 Transcript_15189/m.28458 type:complete len:291 (-) Transcript_15189:35-907(-)